VCSRASTPKTSTTNSWLFPPQTREVQFDEQWAFVGKQEKNGDPSAPADARQGDHWDHVALDPEHRLVLSVVPGERTAENTKELVQDFHRRTEGRIPNLITTDEYPAYATAILETYGETVVPERTGKPGRPKAPYQVPPPALNYATVHKTREKGRVVHIDSRVIFGTLATVLAALALSQVSRAINTAFVERHNGTDRNRNARKVRKTYCFSKDWAVHQAVTYFTMYSYNFCWPVRTLRERSSDGHWQQRTPAMAAGLSDHVWTLTEWLTLPAIQRK
jgi:IS1 family transposase